MVIPLYDYGYNPVKHYMNEVGTQIIVDCGQDISAASTYKLSVRKPDGTVFTWNPTIVTIESNPNYLLYLTRVGDFDQIGVYSIQPYLVLPTWTGRGETVTFEVFGNFDMGY